jgi:hypothetical protein
MLPEIPYAVSLTLAAVFALPAVIVGLPWLAMFWPGRGAFR